MKRLIVLLVLISLIPLGLNFRPSMIGLMLFVSGIFGTIGYLIMFCDPWWDYLMSLDYRKFHTGINNWLNK